MFSIYKYICPNCHYASENKDCTIRIDNKDKHFKEYKCKDCNESFMYSEDMEKSAVCINCGGIYTISLFDGKCPCCGTLMKQLIYFPTYSNVKIQKNKGEDYYCNLFDNTLIKVEEYIVINPYLRKFRINKNKLELWGLVDNYNSIVLFPKYVYLNINEYGNIFIICPKIGLRDYPYCEVDIMGNPIYRSYNKSYDNINTVTFFNIDGICDWYGDFAISIRGTKKGIVHKDGTTVIEPMFDYMELNDYRASASLDNSISNFHFILGTYGEGIICVEEHENTTQGRTRMQYFVNKDMGKELIFNEEWAHKNDIYLENFHIDHNTKCHFENGILKIDIAVDEYWGELFEINRLGEVVRVGDIEYQELRFADTSDFDYSGYEEMGYWNIDDRGYREAFDDDIEVMSNMD